MANPVSVSCPQDVWALVAESVTAGNIKKLNNKPIKYLETYRMTGGAAPTDKLEGAEMFVNGVSESISASAAIDVYVMAIGNDGTIRADLP